MKTRLLTGSILLLLALSSTAQITINRSDIGNLIGGILIHSNDTSNLNLLSPGNSGANQTWDLTGIGNNYQDSMLFLRPQGLSCSDDFSSSTVALLDSGAFQYLYDDNSVIKILGICGVIHPLDTTSVIFSPSLTRVTFPITYNSTFSGQVKASVQYYYNNPPGDSVRIVITTTYNSLIDAWGNVITPTGNYATLRQKFTNFKADSFYVHINSVGWQPTGIVSRDSSIEYVWWSAQNPYIATITTDMNNNVLKAAYLISSNLGVKEIKKNIITYSVIPNPTYGKFTVQTNKGKINTIEIYNIMGKNIFSQKGNTVNSSETIDLSGYPKGIYMIKINNGDDIHTEKVIVQ